MAKGRRHKGHAAEHENAERWLLTYADLITLLMVFFVVLYSMSSADSTKFKRMSAALQQAFNVDVLQGQSQSSIGDGDTPPPPPSTTTTINESEVPQVARLTSKINAVVDGEAQAPSVSVDVDREGVVIRLSGSYLFDSGRAELKPNSLAVLDTIAGELKLIDNEIRVDGHTDSTPIESTRYPTNWELSTARALAVTRYLSATDGVQSTRLMAAGFGEFRPLFVNDTRDHRALNRRVEIHLLSSTLAAPAAPAPISSQASASQSQTTTEHLQP
jgi:chemotaxis protein MotB